MFKKVICASFATMVFVVAGCTTTAHHSGTVAMKITDTEAHVGLGSAQVSEGDAVELFRNICTNPTSPGQEGRVATSVTRRTCVRERGGRGTIAEVLGKDYSVAKFPAGTKFSEGDMVEKITAH